MISEASSSRTRQPHPSQPAACSTQLALGFRFHPTDEELVSYYLKRKVTDRPIRVDAIAEVDLYRVEPWDLPQLSRLRTRDMEWYFFTSLDRKYDNRCRNNRATVDGYWKTTGKDRPVRHRSRIVGMKKTLVYHAGRAPRAQRTNWVMHEYRLEDEDLARQGVQLDGYVLCKIFQKRGPGPQNGAQYGAPFMEEEWEWEEEEEEENKLVPVNVEGADALLEPAGQNYLQLDDFFQDPDSGIEPADPVNLQAMSEQQFSSHRENSDALLEEIFKDLDSLDNTLDAECSTQQDNNVALNGIVVHNSLEDQLNISSIQNNGYVELSDIFGEEKMDSTCNSCPLQPLDSSAIGEVCHFNNMPNKQAEGDSLASDDLASLADQPWMVTSLCMQPDHVDTVPLEILSSQLIEEELVYHDTLSHEIQNLEAFTSEFDFLDDLMAYYDVTEENLDYVPPGSSQSHVDLVNSSEVQSNASSEVVRSCTQSSKEVRVQESLTKHAALERPLNAGGSSSVQSRNHPDTSGLKSKHYQGNPFTMRLASMLDQISAPPAFADESAVFARTAKQITPASASALQVTAAMIRIQDLAVMGCAESWTTQKHAEMRFFLSCGLDYSVFGKSPFYEPRNKVHFGVLSIVLRGSFYLFFLSALLLALTYKVGVFVYNL